jgi:hypothetical protein
MARARNIKAASFRIGSFRSINEAVIAIKAAHAAASVEIA